MASYIEFPEKIRVFENVEPSEAQARKVLEEAGEVLEAWGVWDELKDWSAFYNDYKRNELVNECADVMQATANLLSALGVNDATEAMKQCEERNEKRGRFAPCGDEQEDTCLPFHKDAKEAEALAWVHEHGGIDNVKCIWDTQIPLALGLMTALYPDGMPDECSNDVVMDELHKRLMPEGMEWLVEAWPRFEDDAPVRFLDDFERYGEENGVSVVTMYQDGSFALNCRAYSRGEHVNRPASKVLDADGAEIHVGDTVWLADGRGPWSVSRIVNADRLRVICDNEKNGHLNVYPESLTHRAPVLAADGKPLREGETVWSVDSGTRYTVEKITDGIIPIKCRSEMGSTVSLHPAQLTHERPDSWERLEEDAAKRTCEYFGQSSYSTSCGGCPHEGTLQKTDCRAEKARDIVRRAKALAERGQ